jgi:hypothetical protein
MSVSEEDIRKYLQRELEDRQDEIIEREIANGYEHYSTDEEIVAIDEEDD